MKTPEERWKSAHGINPSRRLGDDEVACVNRSTFLRELAEAVDEAIAHRHNEIVATLKAKGLMQAANCVEHLREDFSCPPPPAAPSLEKRVGDLAEVCEHQERKIDDLQRSVSGLLRRLGKIEEWKDS